MDEDAIVSRSVLIALAITSVIVCLIVSILLGYLMNALEMTVLIGAVTGIAIGAVIFTFSVIIGKAMEQS